MRFVKFLASKNIIAAPELTAPESAPMEESQEGLIKELILIWTTKINCLEEVQSKFILTRKEGRADRKSYWEEGLKDGGMLDFGMGKAEGDSNKGADWSKFGAERIDESQHTEMPEPE